MNNDEYNQRILIPRADFIESFVRSWDKRPGGLGSMPKDQQRICELAGETGIPAQAILQLKAPPPWCLVVEANQVRMVEGGEIVATWPRMTRTERARLISRPLRKASQ